MTNATSLRSPLRGIRFVPSASTANPHPPAVIWQQGVGHFPGYISHSPDLKFSDIPDGVAAIGAVPGVGWAQILWFCGLLELGMFSVKTQRAPGAFNFYRPGGPELGGYPGVTDENRAQKLTIELQNGRLGEWAGIHA